MAYHFSANQFEEGYRAKRLRNWEVPKWYPEHPRTPQTTTQFIVNSRGHLLPGVPKDNPWGNFKGTWDLPRRITKEFAEEINAPPRKLQSIWAKRRAPPDIIEQTEESKPEYLPAIRSADGISFQRRNKSSTALDAHAASPKIAESSNIINVEQNGHSEYRPRDLDQNLKDILDDNVRVAPKQQSPEYCRAIEALQEGKEKVQDQKEYAEKRDKMVPDKSIYGGPLINDYSAFQIAKRFHDENLKHQPLPDVVDDPVFKALASNKDPFPGRALNIVPNAAAIGWKCSGVPGPTKCSKVKVYRPKTAATQTKQPGQDARPKTCDPQKEKRFLPIDLAICWDLSPQDRPKRTQHIDGSHGGEAPSVFAVVRSDDQIIDVPGSAQAVATHIANCVEEDNVGTLPPKIGEKLGTPPKRVTNKSAIMAHVKVLPESRASSFHSLSPESAEIARKNPKTAWSVHDTSKELSERLQELQNCAVNTHTDGQRKGSNDTITSSALLKQKHHQSTPNLAASSVQMKKQCDGSNCGTESADGSSKELKDSKDSRNSKDSREENRLVTKPGVSRNGNGVSPQKLVKIPKMKPPFTKKNYAINTLIPPFSLWPDHHGQEYPEHWRLASVYQHSYKPVDCRRKPLLASIYQ